MADLRSVVYGDKTFTIQQGGDYEARIAALETSVSALQTQLEGYSAVLLQMNGDGSNRTAYDVLGKVHDLRPLNMFEARSGAYDVNGNWLGDLYGGNTESSDYDPAEQYDYEYENSGWDNSIHEVYGDRILAKYPTAKGIVFRYAEMISDGAFKNAQSGDLDWVVLYSAGAPSGYIRPDMSSVTNLFDGGVTDAVSTIYVKDNTNAPWGQTNATVNTTGTPVPWTE